MKKLKKLLYILVLFSISTQALALDSAIVDIYVTVDTIPPVGSITINGGAQRTNTENVVLTLSATDTSGVAEMSFSNDGLTWSEPENYSTTKVWTLTTGDGTKTVYVKYKDEIGNWSLPVQDTIILDTTGPDILTLEANPTRTNSATTITGTVETPSDLKEIKLTGPIQGSPIVISLAEITSGSFSREVTPTSSGNIEATGYDDIGNAGTQKSTPVILDKIVATTIGYIYDDLNRLENVTHDDGTSAAYTYDEVGNITNKTTQGSTP